MNQNTDTIINNYNQMSAYIYCRISTKYSKTSHSIDSQEDQCIEYCKSNKCNVVDIIKDKKSSRNMTNYDELMKLINRMSSGDTLVIADVSRFSRNAFKGIGLLELMKSKGINIYSVKENLNYDDAINRHLFRVFLNQAEYESDVMSTRINTSIKHLKKMGGHPGGKAKFGYEMYTCDGIKKTRKNYSEHRIISRINKNIKNGKKPKDIATELNDLNLLNRGKLWTPLSVKYVYKMNLIK